MKKFTAAFAIAIFFLTKSFAQPLPKDTELKDMTLTDINGVTFSLYEYLDQGYSVLIDISATWCPPCWSFHQAGTMQELYELYGPQGAIQAGKIMPIFIEGDPRTNSNDLKGTGANTQGDWISGKDYHIVDVKNYSEYIPFLYQPQTDRLSFPTFFLICPDKKILYSGNATTSFNRSGIVKMFMACEGGPTSVDGIGSIEAQVTVYPNPVQNVLNIEYKLAQDFAGSGVLKITNVAGQVIYTQAIALSAHQQVISIPTDQYANGMYIVSIETEDQAQLYRSKFVKQ